MTKDKRTNLGYLGYSFQIRLVKQLIEDTKFSEEIMDIKLGSQFTQNR